MVHCPGADSGSFGRRVPAGRGETGHCSCPGYEKIEQELAKNVAFARPAAGLLCRHSRKGPAGPDSGLSIWAELKRKL